MGTENGVRNQTSQCWHQPVAWLWAADWWHSAGRVIWDVSSCLRGKHYSQMFRNTSFAFVSSVVVLLIVLEVHNIKNLWSAHPRDFPHSQEFTTNLGIYRIKMAITNSYFNLISLHFQISEWENPVSFKSHERHLQTVVLRPLSREFCPLQWGWCTHQKPPAVPEPPAPILPSQHEREGLTRRKGIAHCRDYSRTTAWLQGAYLARDTHQGKDAAHWKAFIIRTYSVEKFWQWCG